MYLQTASLLPMGSRPNEERLKPFVEQGFRNARQGHAPHEDHENDSEPAKPEDRAWGFDDESEPLVNLTVRNRNI